MKTQLIIAGILGLLAVTIGAFGAHALKNILEVTGKMDSFETANKYHWYHTFAIIACGILFHMTNSTMFITSAWFFLIGVIIFSGSLYVYSLSNIKFFAIITPVGGLAFIGAWVLFILGVFKSA